MFTLHISFENGSNPWVRFGMSTEELGEELIRWSKEWILRLDYTRTEPQVSCMIFMDAVEKKR